MRHMAFHLHLKTRDDLHITKSCHSRYVAHLYGTVYRCKHAALTPPPRRAPGGNSNRTQSNRDNHTHSRDSVCLLNKWAMTVGASSLRKTLSLVAGGWAHWPPAPLPATGRTQIPRVAYRGSNGFASPWGASSVGSALPVAFEVSYQKNGGQGSPSVDSCLGA